MLNPHLLRDRLEEVAAALERRGQPLDCAFWERLERRHKELQTGSQELRHLRNALSRTIGQTKAAGGDAQSLLGETQALGERLGQMEEALRGLQEERRRSLLELPNLPHATVPDGIDSKDNPEVRRWGKLPEFPFRAKDHVALGEELGMLDFEAAARISGTRFVVMLDAGARLHRALIQFMLDLHTREHGYREVNVPYMVAPHSLEGTGQLPKFEQDLFKAGTGHYLVPTAEVPVTNLVRDRILETDALPLKYVCHSPCFRSEAGSYGQDTRGMIRQHQFEKVELVQIVRPDCSYAVLEELTGHAEQVLRGLELPYRVVELCTGDLGFAAAKTYDLEVWMPGQERYREISSCSNFEAFQARRMMARWRPSNDARPEPVHTLNGSGLAVGRALIAVLENGQQVDGSIRIPVALQPYMNGQTAIERRHAPSSPETSEISTCRD